MTKFSLHNGRRSCFHFSALTIPVSSLECQMLEYYIGAHFPNLGMTLTGPPSLRSLFLTFVIMRSSRMLWVSATTTFPSVSKPPILSVMNLIVDFLVFFFSVLNDLKLINP